MKLRRRLEADAKSLLALNQYGRLHGAVRLRWGFLDEMLPAPWVHRDEPMLHDLMKQAYNARRAAQDRCRERARLGGSVVPSSACASRDGQMGMAVDTPR